MLYSKGYVQKHKKRRKRKKPIQRLLKVKNKEIQISVDLIKGEWVAWYEGTPFINGEGDSLAEAISDLKVNIEDLLLHIEEDLNNNVQLAPYLVDIYKLFAEGE